MSSHVPDPRKNIIEKIKACLNLGNKDKNPNSNEADTALKMAKKLMSDYNISMADVAFDEANFGAIREEALRARAGIPKWEVHLAWVPNHLFNTRYFLKPVSHRSATTGNWQQHHAVVFYGYDRDVALAIEVYKLLKLEILSMARAYELREQTANPTMTPGQLRTRRFAYCEGIVYNLIKRSRDEQENVSAANAAKVRSLVVRKDTTIEEWAKKEHPDLHPMRSRGTGMHEDARYQGSADGDKLSLRFDTAVKHASNAAQLGFKGAKI